jgi:hypothetical protein
MPVAWWFIILAVLAALLGLAIAQGIWWLAWVAGGLLLMVLASMGYALWMAWQSTREGG